MKIEIRKFSCKFFAIMLVWVYVIEATTFYVKSNILDDLIQGTCIVFMIMGVILNGDHGTIKTQKYFWMYMLLLLLAVLPDIISGRTIGYGVMLRYALPLVVDIYLFNYYMDKNKVDDLLLKIPVVYGFIISVHALFFELGCFAGWQIDSVYEFVPKTGNYTPLASMFGIPMGQCAYFGTIAGHRLMRLQGFYIEPSKMSVFLFIPMFIAWGIYRQTAIKKYAVAAMTCFICFIFTMSRAGYIAFLGAVIFSWVIKGRRKFFEQMGKYTTKRDLVKLISFGPIFLTVALLILSFMVLLGQYFPNLSFLYLGITDMKTGKANLMRSETVDIGLIVESLLRRPWGYGFSNSLHGLDDALIDTNLANAFILWLVLGGIGGGLLALFIIFFLLKQYGIPCVKSDNYVVNAVGKTFVAYTIHGLSYGTWMTPDFLIVVGIMAIIYKRNIFIYE